MLTVMRTFSLIFAVLPVLLIVYYVRRNNIYRAYADIDIFKTFFLGMVSVIPIIIGETFIESLVPAQFGFPADNFFIAFLSAGFVEETCKILVIAYVYDRKDFRMRMDGIVFCVVAALGMAFVEDIKYIFQSTDPIQTGIMRAILCIPGHALDTGIAGFFIAVAKQEDRINKIYGDAYVFIGWLSAVFMHGLYDYFVFESSHPSEAYRDWMRGGVLAVFLIQLITMMYLISLARASDKNLPGVKEVHDKPSFINWCLAPLILSSSGSSTRRNASSFDVHSIIKTDSATKAAVLPNRSSRLLLTRNRYLPKR